MPRMCSVHRALQKAGIERHPDLNSPSMPAAGTGTLDVAEDTKYHRHPVDRAFLPAKLAHDRRARLRICADTIVTRVELEAAAEGGDVRATGVHFEASNARKAWKRYFARARREVVLCGGTLGSPQVLLLRCVWLHVWDRYVLILRAAAWAPRNT